jgi:hypothetical protein
MENTERIMDATDFDHPSMSTQEEVDIINAMPEHTDMRDYTNGVYEDAWYYVPIDRKEV